MDDVDHVSAGWWYTLAVKSDGSLWAWGRNGAGQLGDGTGTSRSTPTKIMDGVVQVSASEKHTLAVKSDGSLWVWGRNECGQLGNGTIENTPIKIIVGVA